MIPPDPTEAARVAAVRAVLPALAAGIYLNTGTSGPIPLEAAAVLEQMGQHELTIGRADTASFYEWLDRAAETRAAIAALLTTDLDDIGLTHSTTDGMNIGVAGIDWRPGDRAVTTRLEHPGGVGPLYLQRERHGIDVEFLDVGHGGDHEAIIAAFDRAIDDRTRAVVISHVLWATGAVMPVEAIAAIAHERGALVIVDGAQSAGAMSVDLAATGADVYAIPGQKWLLGPEGTGAVAVRAAGRDRIPPLAGGYLSFERVDSSGEAALWSSARRYEGTGFHRPSVVALGRSVGWLSMFVGLAWVYERGARLARAMVDRLAAIPGVEVLTPRDHMATLVTFRIGGWTPDEVVAELGARIFAITRTITLVDAVRISVGFYNTEEELERFAETVELLAAHTPATLPARRTLAMLGEA